MKTSRVLVVAAHPDDEILGCGGAMARHAAEGSEVWSLIVAEGITSRAGLSAAKKKAELKKLHAMAKRANDAVGTKKLILESFPDNKLDTVPRLDAVQAIEKVVTTFGPDTVYTHSPADLNVDHQIVSEAVRTACRPLPGSTVRSVYFFEVRSSTEWRFDPGVGFEPNSFLDVTDYLQRKLAALRAYAGEMRPFPHSRSLEAVEAQARLRGAQAGFQAAEAFQLARRILP
jgi:N-acetylglucosamine malate deacetylase 1